MKGGGYPRETQKSEWGWDPDARGVARVKKAAVNCTTGERFLAVLAMSLLGETGDLRQWRRRLEVAVNPAKSARKKLPGKSRITHPPQGYGRAAMHGPHLGAWGRIYRARLRASRLFAARQGPRVPLCQGIQDAFGWLMLSKSESGIASNKTPHLGQLMCPYLMQFPRPSSTASMICMATLH